LDLVVIQLYADDCTTVTPSVD